MKRVAAVFLSLFLVACGYRLAGGPDGPALSRSEGPAISVAIPIFTNVTTEPLLEKKVTVPVQKEFMADARWRVVTSQEEAHVVLKGRIISFGLTPLSFDARGLVAEYRVTLVVEAELQDAKKSKTLWKEGGIVSTAEYHVTGIPSVDRDREDRAIEEAGAVLAQNLVALIRFPP